MVNPALAAAFSLFTDRIRRRLEVGAREYGDASLSRPVPELLDEMQQELEDVCGWCTILWMRLNNLRNGWPMNSFEAASGD